MLTFPLNLRFKLIAVASQIEVTDGQSGPVFYVRQKAFKLKEAVTVYRDSTQGQVLYRIAADCVLFVSSSWAFEGPMQRPEVLVGLSGRPLAY